MKISSFQEEVSIKNQDWSYCYHSSDENDCHDHGQGAKHENIPHSYIITMFILILCEMLDGPEGGYLKL